MPGILVSFVYLLVIVLVIAVLYWAFTKIAAAFSAPAPIMTVIQVLFVVLLCVVIGSWLLSLVGAAPWFPVPGGYAKHSIEIR